MSPDPYGAKENIRSRKYCATFSIKSNFTQGILGQTLLGCSMNFLAVVLKPGWCTLKNQQQKYVNYILYFSIATSTMK